MAQVISLVFIIIGVVLNYVLVKNLIDNINIKNTTVRDFTERK